ncbi:hypothetical protein KXX19_004009 [Aspergillus fumigatus]|nr:hypothetical protein KXX19_004009 [Aspergillus fumigatus]
MGEQKGNGLGVRSFLLGRLLFYYPAVELPKIFKPSKYVILGGPGPITGESLLSCPQTYQLRTFYSFDGYSTRGLACASDRSGQL